MAIKLHEILVRFFVVWLVAIDLHGPPSSTTRASVLPLSSARKSAIHDSANVLLVQWIKSRTAVTASLDQYTNGKPASLWLYQGSLMDPLTGKVLAAVEGFEIVILQGLWAKSTNSNEDEKIKSYLARLPASPVSNWTRALFRQRTDLVEAAATWESRKVFMYRTNDQSRELLASVRLRPAGPQRKVPLSQAISTWHATTTVVQTDRDGNDDDNVRNSTTPATRTMANNNNNNNNNNFFFGTALNMAQPQQQSHRPTLVWNTAPVTWEPITVDKDNDTRKKRKKNQRTQQQQQTPTGNLEFTIHARPRRGSQEAALQRHFAKSTASSGLAPPRSAIVSLGGNSGASPRDATAAHETYRYHLPSGRVSYSRYGEGPVWYGPHRTCRLELRGQVQSDLTQLSPVAQELVRRLASTPCLTVEQLFPEEIKARQVAEKWPIWHKHVRWAQPYWQRVLQATSLQPSPTTAREW